MTAVVERLPVLLFQLLRKERTFQQFIGQRLVGEEQLDFFPYHLFREPDTPAELFKVGAPDGAGVRKGHTLSE